MGKKNKPRGKVVCTTEQHLVIDNVLSPDSQTAMWNYFQAQAFMRVDSQGTAGHWLIEDSAVLRGPTVGYQAHWDAQYPTKTPMDLIIEAVLGHAQDFESVVGMEGQAWEVFSAVAALYPRQTGLMWHRDHATFAGSWTWYAHPQWNIEWGGALLVSDETSIPDEQGVYFHRLPESAQTPEAGAWQSHLDNEDASKLLMRRGLGYHVMPKPNRLVVIRGGAPHAISKVTDAAGRHVRASVSGFFCKHSDLANAG